MNALLGVGDGVSPVAGRRLIVEVRGGRASGTKAVIDPGRTLRFGRTELADVAVPGDEMLSGVHFELSWDGERCQLRDRRSHGGTTLGGAPVLTAEVPHGGWIRAGRTDFLVHVEGNSARALRASSLDGAASGPKPPRARARALRAFSLDGAASGPKPRRAQARPFLDDDSDMDPEADDSDVDEDASVGLLMASGGAGDIGASVRLSAAERVLRELRTVSSEEPLYAILDAARDERIVPILRESVEPHKSLYEGVDGEALEDVAPYLAGPMRADSMLLDRLVLEGWGERWGIFVTSAAPFKEVRRHFRRFLMVEMLETDEKLYFRFYDPVILERFTNHWSPAQKRDVMDSISRLFVPDASLGLKAVTP